MYKITIMNYAGIADNDNHGAEEVLDDSTVHYSEEDRTVVNPVVKTELNKAGSFEFTILHTNRFYDKIKLIKTVISVYLDGIMIFRGRVMSISDDIYRQRSVFCEGELAYLNDSLQPPKKESKQDVGTYFIEIIENHNSQMDIFKDQLKTGEDDKSFWIGRIGSFDNGHSFRITTDDGRVLTTDEDGFVPLETKLEWELGDISDATYKNVDSKRRIRTKKAVYVRPGSIVSSLNGHKFRAVTYSAYTDVNTFTKDECSAFSSENYVFGKNTYVRFVVELNEDEFISEEIPEEETEETEETEGTEEQQETETTPTEEEIAAYVQTQVDEIAEESIDVGKLTIVVSSYVYKTVVDSPFKSEGYRTTFEALESDVLDVYGGYLRIRYEEGPDKKMHRALDYIEKQGLYEDDPENRKITFGVNLQEITKETKGDDVFSVLLPTGDNNLLVTGATKGKTTSTVRSTTANFSGTPLNSNLSSNNLRQVEILLSSMSLPVPRTIQTGENTYKRVAYPAMYVLPNNGVETYGPIFKTQSFSGVTKREELLSYAQNYISHTYKSDPTTYTLKSVDMHFVDPQTNKIITIGCLCTITLYPNEVVQNRICTAATYELQAPENNEYTFDDLQNESKSLTSKYRKQTTGGGRTSATAPSTTASPDGETGNEDTVFRSNGNIIFYPGTDKMFSIPLCKTFLAPSLTEWMLGNVKYTEAGGLEIPNKITAKGPLTMSGDIVLTASTGTQMGQTVVSAIRGVTSKFFTVNAGGSITFAGYGPGEKYVLNADKVKKLLSMTRSVIDSKIVYDEKEELYHLERLFSDDPSTWVKDVTTFNRAVSMIGKWKDGVFNATPKKDETNVILSTRLYGIYAGEPEAVSTGPTLLEVPLDVKYFEEMDDEAELSDYPSTGFTEKIIIDGKIAYGKGETAGKNSAAVKKDGTWSVNNDNSTFLIKFTTDADNPDKNTGLSLNLKLGLGNGWAYDNESSVHRRYITVSEIIGENQDSQIIGKYLNLPVTVVDVNGPGNQFTDQLQTNDSWWKTSGNNSFKYVIPAITANAYLNTDRNHAISSGTGNQIVVDAKKAIDYGKSQVTLYKSDKVTGNPMWYSSDHKYHLRTEGRTNENGVANNDTYLLDPGDAIAYGKSLIRIDTNVISVDTYTPPVSGNGSASDPGKYVIHARATINETSQTKDADVIELIPTAAWSKGYDAGSGAGTSQGFSDGYANGQSNVFASIAKVEYVLNTVSSVDTNGSKFLSMQFNVTGNLSKIPENSSTPSITNFSDTLVLDSNALVPYEITDASIAAGDWNSTTRKITVSKQSGGKIKIGNQEIDIPVTSHMITVQPLSVTPGKVEYDKNHDGHYTCEVTGKVDINGTDQDLTPTVIDINPTEAIQAGANGVGVTGSWGGEGNTANPNPNAFRYEVKSGESNTSGTLTVVAEKNELTLPEWVLDSDEKPTNQYKIKANGRFNVGSKRFAMKEGSLTFTPTEAITAGWNKAREFVNFPIEESTSNTTLTVEGPGKSEGNKESRTYNISVGDEYVDLWVYNGTVKKVVARTKNTKVSTANPKLETKYLNYDKISSAESGDESTPSKGYDGIGKVIATVIQRSANAIKGVTNSGNQETDKIILIASSNTIPYDNLWKNVLVKYNDSKESRSTATVTIDASDIFLAGQKDVKPTSATLSNVTVNSSTGKVYASLTVKYKGSDWTDANIKTEVLNDVEVTDIYNDGKTDGNKKTTYKKDVDVYFTGSNKFGQKKKISVECVSAWNSGVEASSSTPSVPEYVYIYAKKNDGQVNMRKSPSGSSANVGKLYCNTKVKFISESGGYVYIYYSGYYGYVSCKDGFPNDFVWRDPKAGKTIYETGWHTPPKEDSTEESKVYAYAYAEHNNSYVVVREKPSSSSQVLGTLKCNTKVEYLGQSNGFAYIRYSKYYGYISCPSYPGDFVWNVPKDGVPVVETGWEREPATTPTVVHSLSCSSVNTTSNGALIANAVELSAIKKVQLQAQAYIFFTANCGGTHKDFYISINN